jgi:hypothetical protein
MFDEYIRQEVVPFIHASCQTRGSIATMGASLGFITRRTLFGIRTCSNACTLSGVFDLKRFMDGCATTRSTSTTR